MNVLNNMIRDHWIDQNPHLIVEIEETRDLGRYEAPTLLTLHIENAISGTRLSISLPRVGKMVAKYEGGLEIEREIDLTESYYFNGIDVGESEKQFNSLISKHLTGLSK